MKRILRYIIALFSIGTYKSVYNSIKLFPDVFYKLPVRIFGKSLFKYNKSSQIIIKDRLYIGSHITELSNKKTRVIIRGNSYLIIDGRVDIGPGVNIIVNDNAKLYIGDKTYIAADSKIYSSKSIHIGNNCALSWGLNIIDSDFHILSYCDREHEMTSPIYIEDNVWIGCNVTILKGVRIGDGAVIGAGSVVTRDIPSNCVAVGNPAKVVHENIKWVL
ncbi:acyltransferase [Lutispora thermophila]|uniref:Acetyltransferase (Isoleucine patch superfamily) n=1 Tax=Lutispora thermophila DSM 19022 TaxID=1122184 RepID=A0A1M6BYJ1_9FIRM|nr:acyltransferase [Lutispora thermophila]SHI53594.1 Acetyltransferase (isoleucine patch superfamily) [Lutispora thermophila DSM 19022]